MNRYVRFLGRHDLRDLRARRWSCSCWRCSTATPPAAAPDFRELLPQDDPELKALQRIGDRIGARSTLVIAVEGPDPRANERFADALVANLQPLVGRDLRAIDYRADATQAFFEQNKVLYADLGDLRRADDDLKKLLVSKKNPAFVPFADADLGEEKDDPAADLRQLKRDIEQRHGPRAVSERLLRERGPDAAGHRHLDQVVGHRRSVGLPDPRRRAAGDRPDRPGPLRRRAGRRSPATSRAPSRSTTRSSPTSSGSPLVCAVAVLLVIALYYRSVVALTYIFFPTLARRGDGAFAIAALTIGYLNTNTAFLGSIILGNGINFGIILLARYREQRGRQSGADASRRRWRSRSPRRPSRRSPRRWRPRSPTAAWR